MPRILLVEDNEMNSDMLTRRLSKRGFEVLLASNGREAIELARTLNPQLVLMDMSLPEIDGWEATRRLKRDPATSGIPVIGLTAHAMSEDRQRAFDAGCDDYDTKPVDLNRLIGKIALHLNRSQEEPAQGRATVEQPS